LTQLVVLEAASLLGQGDKGGEIAPASGLFDSGTAGDTRSVEMDETVL
jgi:hypothetical protein